MLQSALQLTCRGAIQQLVKEVRITCVLHTIAINLGLSVLTECLLVTSDVRHTLPDQNVCDAIGRHYRHAGRTCLSVSVPGNGCLKDLCYCKWCLKTFGSFDTVHSLII